MLEIKRNTGLCARNAQRLRPHEVALGESFIPLILKHFEFIIIYRLHFGIERIVSVNVIFYVFFLPPDGRGDCPFGPVQSSLGVRRPVSGNLQRSRLAVFVCDRENADLVPILESIVGRFGPRHRRNELHLVRRVSPRITFRASCQCCQYSCYVYNSFHNVLIILRFSFHP